ncbi:MAG: endonuclease III domain-containing protein [Candidatus Geothermarchaeales archaeon]
MQAATFGVILDILSKDYPVRPWESPYTPFETLIRVVLSQATSREGVKRGFERLRRRFKLTPEAMARADVGKIKECIRICGLYNAKAERIRKIAEIILREFNGDLNDVLNLPLIEAREKLMELPGVGNKTADVLLCSIAGKGAFPVDTHITRIAKRLKLVEKGARYREIRSRLEDLTPEGLRWKAHLLLIEFGRTICTARNPRCNICPISQYCPRV